MVARMPGRLVQPRCPHCRAAPGPDCASKRRSKRRVRYRLKRELRAEERQMESEWY